MNTIPALEGELLPSDTMRINGSSFTRKECKLAYAMRVYAHSRNDEIGFILLLKRRTIGAMDCRGLVESIVSIDKERGLGWVESIAGNPCKWEERIMAEGRILEVYLNEKKDHKVG